jgi:hypothetical protein
VRFPGHDGTELLGDGGNGWLTTGSRLDCGHCADCPPMVDAPPIDPRCPRIDPTGPGVSEVIWPARRSHGSMEEAQAAAGSKRVPPTPRSPSSTKTRPTIVGAAGARAPGWHRERRSELHLRRDPSACSRCSCRRCPRCCVRVQERRRHVRAPRHPSNHQPEPAGRIQNRPVWTYKVWVE